MSQNLNVALTLSLQDRLTASHARATNTVKQGYRGIHPEVERLSRLTSTANRNMSGLARTIDRTVSGLRSMARAVPSAFAAYNAAKFVLADPIRKTQDYELRLAQMANTAFTGRDTAGRRAGALQLDAAVSGAVRFGGGTREGAAETLDTLIASGAVGVNDATKLLPTLQRFSTASGADPNQLANIAIRGMQSFKIAADDMPRLLDMAITAGQAGGFELRDMARWLPQQMAAARMSGLTGLEGITKLLAANQAAAITAGTRDEAGNNLVNLLAKINSDAVGRDFKREFGIDLSGSLAAARGKGMSSLDAFVALVDKEVVGKDKRYQDLRTKAATGSDSDRRASFEGMADILQGSAIGKVMQDRQALMALIALMNNREYLRDVEAQVRAGTGAGERNFATIQDTAAFRAQQLANEKAIGMQTALNQVNPLLGRTAVGLANLAQQYPTLTAAIMASTLALTALAAAAGAAGIARFVMRGGAAAGAAGTAGGAAAGATLGASAVALLAKAKMGAALLLGAPSLAAIGSMGAGAIATAGAGVAAAGGAGYGIGTLLNEYLVTPLVEQFIGMRADMEKTALRSPQEIVVRVENGSIVADVQRTANIEAKRH